MINKRTYGCCSFTNSITSKSSEFLNSKIWIPYKVTVCPGGGTHFSTVVGVGPQTPGWTYLSKNNLPDSELLQNTHEALMRYIMS